MFRGLTALALGALLAACSAGPQTREEGPGSPVPAPSELGPAPEESPLYHVLVGEIAGARGSIDVAAEAYGEAAARSRDPAVAERAARIALYADAAEPALAATQRWLDLAPDSAEARRLLGLLHLRTGDADAAYRAFAGSLPGEEADASDREAAIGRLGELLAEEARDRAGLQVARRLAEEHPQSPAARLAVARVALALERPGRALGAAREAQELRPGWTAARLLEIDALMALEREGAAVEALRALLEETPENEALRLRYARMLVRVGRNVDALDEFRQLVEARPEDPEVLYSAALVALESGRYDFARQCLMRLRERDGQENVAAYYLGRLAELEDDSETALRRYERAGGEYRGEAQLRIALVLADQGRVIQARNHLAELREGDSGLAPRTWAIEGELLRDAGRVAESVEVLSRGLDAYPENTDLLYGRAMSEIARDRLEPGERDLRRIIEAEPENAHALNALGYTLVDRTERVDEGAELIERAYELQPGDPAIIDSMGWAAYRQGELQEAREYLERAYELARDAEIAAHLGEVLWHLGERERARAIWEAAREDAPDHPVLRETMERLLP